MPTEPDMEDVVVVLEKYAKQIESMKARLSAPVDESIDSVICYRFLKGFKFNADKAGEQLEKMNVWRRDNNMTSIRQSAQHQQQRDFPHYQHIIKYYPHNISHSHDKHGQPLSIDRLGLVNPSLLCKNVTLQQLTDYHLAHMENKAALAAEMTRQTGKVIRMAKIVDLSGLGRQHLSRQGLMYLQTLLEMSQAYYPEMLGTMYVCETPWIFNMLWNIVKPWLNESTLAKIRIFSKDSYQQALQQNIDKDYIPQIFGGNCTCVGKGGCVVQIDPDEGMTTMIVPARSRQQVCVAIQPVDLAADGCQINYSFRTKEHDIQFQLLQHTQTPQADAPRTLVTPIQNQDKASDPTHRTLLQLRRYAGVETVEHMQIVTEPCTLKLQFDNAYSFMTSKTVLYRVHVQPYTQLTNSTIYGELKQADPLLDEPQTPSLNE